MADNLKALLSSLSAVEKKGDTSMRHQKHVSSHIDSLDGGSMLTGGSMLDDETLSHYVDGGGNQASLRSVRDSTSSNRGGKKVVNRGLSKKNL